MPQIMQALSLSTVCRPPLPGPIAGGTQPRGSSCRHCTAQSMPATRQGPSCMSHMASDCTLPYLLASYRCSTDPPQQQLQVNDTAPTAPLTLHHRAVSTLPTRWRTMRTLLRCSSQTLQACPLPHIALSLPPTRQHCSYTAPTVCAARRHIQQSTHPKCHSATHNPYPSQHVHAPSHMGMLSFTCVALKRDTAHRRDTVTESRNINNIEIDFSI